MSGVQLKDKLLSYSQKKVAVDGITGRTFRSKDASVLVVSSL